MAITYPISLPSSPVPATVEWGGLSVSGESVSIFTQSQETFQWSGRRWMASVRYPAMTRANADPIIAALQQLHGRYGTLLFGPNGAAATARGLLGGTPLVNGASQSGQVLVIDGATPNITGWVKAGDFFQLGSGSTARLFQILKDANSDGSGNVSLDIWPNLRTAPSDNDPLTFASPKGVFRLMDDFPKWTQDKGGVYGLSFELAEAF